MIGAADRVVGAVRAAHLGTEANRGDWLLQELDADHRTFTGSCWTRDAR